MKKTSENVLIGALSFISWGLYSLTSSHLKKGKKIAALGIFLAAVSTIFWLSFQKTNGWIPWSYGPEQLTITRILDPIFLIFWCPLLCLVYPELGERAIITSRQATELKRVHLRSGIFLMIAWQFIFDRFTFELEFSWWYWEIGISYGLLAIATLLFVSSNPRRENSPYVILGMALGLGLGSTMAAGLIMGLISLLPTLAIISLYRYRTTEER